MAFTALSLEQTVQTVRQGVGFASLETLGILQVQGRDAAAFLHSQTSNDVLGLSPSQGQFNTLLDRKAHLQACFSLHCLDQETFWLLLEHTLIASVTDRLEAFHFSEQFTMQPISAPDWVFVTLQGPLSRQLLERGMTSQQSAQLVSPEYSIIQPKTLFGSPSISVIRRSLTGETGYIFLISGTEAPSFLPQLQQAGESWGMVPLTGDAMETLRIETGLLRWGVDIPPDTLLPETGLEQIAVSTTKGCYQGQEVIGKIKAVGSTPKGIIGLLLQPGEAPPPSPPLSLSCRRKNNRNHHQYHPFPYIGRPYCHCHGNQRLPRTGQDVLTEDW